MQSFRLVFMEAKQDLPRKYLRPSVVCFLIISRPFTRDYGPSLSLLCHFVVCCTSSVACFLINSRLCIRDYRPIVCSTNVCFQFQSNYYEIMCCHATNLMTCIHKVYFAITVFYRRTLTHILYYRSAPDSSRNDPSNRLGSSSVAWWLSVANKMQFSQ